MTFASLLSLGLSKGLFFFLSLQDPAAPVDPGKQAKSLPLTLQSCISLALEHNLDIETARFQPWIEEQNVAVSRGSFDPIAYLNASGGEELTATSSSLAGASVLDTDTFQYALGLRTALSTGPSLDVFYQGNRYNSNNAFSTLNPYWSEALGISLTVPLLQGAGEDSAYSTVILARHTQALSLYDFETTLIESLFAVEKAYWNLILTQETLKVRQKALEVATRLADDRRQMFERGAGAVTKVDVTQAESQVATQKEGVLTAENDVQDAMDQLKLLTDPSLLRTTPIEIVPQDKPRTPEKSLDETGAIRRAQEEALARRPDVRSARQQIESQQALVRKYDRDLLPKLDFVADASTSGIDGNHGNALDEALTRDYREYTAGIILEVPLGNDAARGRFQGAELEERRLHTALRNLENQVLVEVRQAVREVRTTEERIRATAEAVRLAQEQFDAEWSRRAAGLRTTFHVLDAQKILTEALTNEIKARIDYTLALSDLQRVSGTLLPGYGVRIDDHRAMRH